MAQVTTGAATAAAPAQTHPLYQAWQPIWAKLLDVYEGAGGFLDEAKPYLLAHPREWLDHSVKDSTGADIPNPNPRNPHPKLVMRRKLARYENVAQAGIEAYRGALFREGPTRAFAGDTAERATRVGKPRPIETWWGNADGRGNSLTDCLKPGWTAGAVFGHALLVLDRAADGAAPGRTDARPSPSLADVAMPVLRLYSPLDVADWLVDDRGELTAVRLLEPEPRTTLDARVPPTAFRTRTLTETTWRLEDSRGETIDEGEHGFGRLPAEPLYARRRTLIPVIGQSVLQDPQLYLDLYNLVSECRELLRQQTFGILNVPLGENGSVEMAQQLMGQQAGTNNVLLTALPGQYLSPSADNVRVYHEEIDRLLRSIYRLWALPWEGDSRDVESADARRLKRADLHQVLVSFAHELERTEMRLCELVYRGIFGADRWEREWNKDQPYVSYPTEFDVESVEQVIEACDAAIRLEIGETNVKAAKKRTARRLVPGLSPQQQAAGDEEIEAQTIETADARHQRQLDMALARFQGAAPGEPPTAAEGEA